MNKEETMEILRSLHQNAFYYFPDERAGWIREACDMSMKALENQKTLQAELEKIKSEIEKESEEMASVKDWGRYYGLNLSIEIIDKHIAELKGENE